MKSNVILFCVVLFCSKIVDSIPHSENHVRQRVDPPTNWQVNKKVPNAQYLNTDFTQPRNVNKLTNSAIQQENNEDYYSNQRGYYYDGYGYNKSPASSPSDKELLVNYDSPADGRRLDSYPSRVESYPSHTSQDGFDHQQYRNQKRLQNPFTNSVPSSVFIPNEERPLVTSDQEPYRGFGQYVKPKYVPSLNRPFYQPGRSYLTKEQLQYPSVDHTGVNKYVVNPATRFGSRGLVPFENYSESQASETKTRPTGVRRYVQNFETPSEINYETPDVESPDTLADQSVNIRYSVPYENYREGQVSESKTRLNGVHRHVQNFETPSEVNYKTPAVESSDTLVDQSENKRYPVPYENYREGQVSETKTRTTGVRRHVQNFETPSEINYETPAVESPDTFVDQSENIRYPVPYEIYRESQVSETKRRLNGVRKHVRNSEINYETPAVESPVTLVDRSENIIYSVPYENYREGQVSETKTEPTGVRRHVQDFETPSEINYETPAVESPDTFVDQSENIRYPVPYEIYRESQVSETKRRLNGVRKHVQNSDINYETPAIESPVTLVDRSENIRYPVPYEDYREGQESETKTRLTGVRRHVQNFETPSDVNYETPALGFSDTLVDQSENIRYPVPYEIYRESQVSETKRKLNGVRKHVQNSEINYETSAVKSSDTLVDQSDNIIYSVPYENYREGQVSETKTEPTGVRRHVQDFETPSEINYETPAVESPDTLAGQSENIKYVESSRSGSHLSDSAPITSHDDGTPVISETDNYSSDSRSSNLTPLVNVKKEAIVEISKILADKYARRSDYGWSNIGRDNSNNDAPTDIIETLEVKEGKYGTNYAEEKAVQINSYPEHSFTPTNTELENSGSHTYEESNVPQYGSSSPNNSKQNAIHHLTSEIKELSLKSLVANPEIQHILSRTDKRYVVVHSNGTIEYLDKLPLDSQQDSKLHLVHTKRKNIDGSEGDGVLTPQWPQNSPSNIVKTPAPVDEYQWPTNNQPADEYDSNRVIPFKKRPTGHSHLKPLVPHSEQPDNDNTKALPPPVNQSDDGGYSKPLIPNEDQPVDDSNSNQPKDHANSKSLDPNEAQPAYDANPKPTPEILLGDVDISNPLPLDVNHSTDDDTFKHWTSTKNQPRNEDSSKPLFTDANQSKDKINLTPYARNPVHVKRHKHAYVTLPANDNTFKPLLPDEAQPRDNRNSELAHSTQTAHDKKSKHSQGNQPENDDNLNPSSLNKNQPADDINSEPLNENLTGDDIVSKLLHPYYRHNKKSKHSHVNEPADSNNPNPSSTPEPLYYPENQPADDNAAEPLPSNEDDEQPEDDTSDKTQKLNENQSVGDIDSELLSPHKKPRAHHNKARPKHSHVNLESDDNSNLSSQHQPGDDNAAEPLPSNEDDKQPEDDSSDKPQKLNENKSEGDIDSEPLSPRKKPRAHHNKAKPKHSHVNLESDDDNSNPSSQHENQAGDDNAAESLPSNKDDKQPEDDKSDKPQKLNKNQSEGDIDSEPLSPHKKPRAHHNKAKPKHSHENLESDDDNSNPSSQHENQPGDDNAAESLPSNKDDKQPEDDKSDKPQKLNKNQSEGDIDSEPLSPHKKPRAHHNKAKPKHSHENLESDDDNSNPSSQPDSHPKDETDSTPSPPHKKPRAHYKKPKHSDMNQPAYDAADENNSKQPSSDESQPEDDKKSKSAKSLSGNQHADDNNIKLPSSYENQPAGDKTPKQSASETESKPSPHKKQRAHRNKSKHSNVNKPANDNNSNPASLEKNQLAENNAPKPLPSNADQSGDETDSKLSLSHKKQPAHRKKPKHSHVYVESDDNNANPSSQDENQQRDNKTVENQSEDETVTTPLSPHKKQRAHHKKPKHSDVNKSVDDNNSETSPHETQIEDDKKSKSLPTSESQSTNDNNSKPSPPKENRPEDDIISKPTPVLSKNDDESRSTTLSPIVSSYTTTHKPQAIKKYKRKHSHRKTKTNSPVVSTTPSPDDSSEDQIITLSPIEQVTDNVSYVPTLTTTTAKPVETPDKQDTYKDANNKPDESHDNTKSPSEDKASISDKVKTSTSTASSSTSPTDNASDGKTKGKSEENENKAVVSKENNGKDNTQTAVYISSELLDTNTDVPEESDDYSPVAPSPSVQNDVDTVDASGDNSSELEQSETDVTITVSSNTTYDSEDEIITINIGVSESTDDADSPSNDKMLVVSIDTNPDDDDETDVSKTTKTEDCQDDRNYDDGRGNDVEIDLSNLKGQPTMWIKTTNQHFIDQLTAKKDTLLDVIYFFSVENQPTIEREKETTIFCNGTVVIDTTEITYAHKDDPTPTIVKTTEIMQIEDYELNK